MKCSELWLQEFIGATAWQNAQKSGYPELLTMGGLEVEARIPIALPFTQVVVGEVVACEKHKEAARLSICQVKVDASDKLLTIVCGASNVKAGIRVPVALVGATLPNNTTITKATLRGIESHGMICAADELGLEEDSDGIMVLPDDAPLGIYLRDYLLLDDTVLELAITPNRGDCLSILGVAREIAALTPTDWQASSHAVVKHDIQEVMPVTINDPMGCPHYVGRIIKEIDLNMKTPITIKMRLERSGIRTINPVVDVTNYVMLALGQPMHAFDLAELKGGIIVRNAVENETIHLLDETEVKLNDKTLLIADHEKPLAIAGVMGGLHSGISDVTRDIFLESAYFDPNVIAKQRQTYGIQSESSYRFERGVDFNLQASAMEYATSLILSICGGKPGPLIREVAKTLPETPTISLPINKIKKQLGVEIKEKTIFELLARLNMKVTIENDTLWVVPPSYRFDLKLPEDLIEELARLYGYQNIPLHIPSATFTIPRDNRLNELKDIARSALMFQGLHEIITYSFVDQSIQTLLNPSVAMRPLANPIVSTMNVMRTNLWPGLIETVIYNQNRKQFRTHLFEVGTVFTDKESVHLAMVMSGNHYEGQWAEPNQPVDFFDLKGQVENLLKTFNLMDYHFAKSTHPALHPGQQASIIISNGVSIGVFGMLHPRLTQQFDLLYPAFLSDLSLDQICQFNSKKTQKWLSKFPAVRRDIALLVDKSITYAKIQDTIKSIAGNLLKEVFIFDVYEGENIPLTLKSIAFAIVLQAMDRTLVDEEVTTLIDKVIVALKETYGAELRR